MPGLDKDLQVVYKIEDTITLKPIGQWVNGLMSANSGDVQQVDATTEFLPLTNPDLMMYSTDNSGFISYKQVLGVRRVKLSELDTPQILKFRLQSGRFLTVLADTLIGSRSNLNNIFDGVPASNYYEGDCMGYGLTCHQQYGDPPQMRELVFSVETFKYVPIPHIITYTWGELTMSRRDAEAFLQVVLDHPDEVDQRDEQVFREVLGEMMVFDPIISITDLTGTYTEQYMYDIEIDTGSYQIYTQYEFGTPGPGTVYKPMSKEDRDRILQSKKTEQEPEALLKSIKGRPSA